MLAGDVPATFVAVTVIVATASDANPVSVNGEDDPVAVWPVLAVAVKDVAAGEFAGNSNDTVKDPLPYGLFVPTSVATMFTGANGAKKSFAAWDLPPIFLLTAIGNLLFPI